MNRISFLLIALAILTSPVFAKDVCLVAMEFTQTLEYDAQTVSIPMWGYALDDDGTCDGVTTNAATSPGPRIELEEGGERDLTITLINQLPVPTSIVIPGGSMPAVTGAWPVWDTGDTGPRTSLSQRVRSFTAEAGAGMSATYEWSNVQGNRLPIGSLIYQSGTDISIQRRMGLYGPVAHYQNRGAGVAIPGFGFDEEVDLFYSEIDPAFHTKIANFFDADPGTEGSYTPGDPTDYSPRYFLVNGAVFDPAQPGLQTTDVNQGSRVHLRFYNASAQIRVPVVNRLDFLVGAQDGDRLNYVETSTGASTNYNQIQSALLLPPGKTIDARLRSGNRTGSFTLYDRRGALTNDGTGEGGMIYVIDINN